MLFNRLNKTYFYKDDFNFVNTIILKNTMNISEKFSMAYLLPIFITFFVMGFVDIVRVFTSYVKSDFVLNNPLANLLPMMVFFYCLLSVWTEETKLAEAQKGIYCIWKFRRSCSDSRCIGLL